MSDETKRREMWWQAACAAIGGSALDARTIDPSHTARVVAVGTTWAAACADALVAEYDKRFAPQHIGTDGIGRPAPTGKPGPGVVEEPRFQRPRDQR